MSERDSNVIDLARHRRLAQNPKRDESRSNEAEELIRKLQGTKRLHDDDRSIIAKNLGSLIDELGYGKREVVTKQVLGLFWEKRKRYVLFSNEAQSPAGKYAASGGAFARIIRELVRIKASQDSNPAQALAKTVRKALKDTSFRARLRFQMPDTAGDISELCKVMTWALDELDEVSGLADYFARVSQYPIYLREERAAGDSFLELCDCKPNNIFACDAELEEDDDDDDVMPRMPWWAPKCIIGHLYVPFKCNIAYLPTAALKTILHEYEGDLERARREWNRKSLGPRLTAQFLDQGSIVERYAYHRLPIWLVVAPSSSYRLVARLYTAASWHWDPFPGCPFSLSRAAFVDYDGTDLSGDPVYLEDEDIPRYQFATCIRGYGNGTDLDYLELSAIGPDVEEKAVKVGGCRLLTEEEFRSEVYWFDPKLPTWLNSEPVHRFLPISEDSTPAKLFALRPRVFANDDNVLSGTETVFRPAFADCNKYTPLPRNTIGGFILRNLTYPTDQSILKVLKDQAIAKVVAVNELIRKELSTYCVERDSRFPRADKHSNV